MAMATWLEEAVELSRLKYVSLPNWKTRKSAGGEDYKGVLCHHTGSYDGLADAKNDYDYAMWMATQGRSDLPPPLCNLALSAEGVVYLAAAGNANHAGSAKATGPMPSASDGNRLYIGIEAMNSGSQGWGSLGKDRDGNNVTQYDAYVRLCAAICLVADWPASHVRAHKETSSTGKWDPGMLNMDHFRADVANEMKNLAKPRPRAPYPVYGEVSNRVRRAQKLLNALDVVSPKLVVDGDYGPKTKAAVLQFEKSEKNLKKDGLFGKISWARLQKVAGPKAKGDE